MKVDIGFSPCGMVQRCIVILSKLLGIVTADFGETIDTITHLLSALTGQVKNTKKGRARSRPFAYSSLT